MKRIKLVAAVVLTLGASTGQAQEFSAFYGKGISHNPNADMSAYTLSWPSGSLLGRPAATHIITGEAYGPGTLEHGARPFKFGGIGKELKLAGGNTFCTVGGGVAMYSRTADAVQYAVATYYKIACGIEYRGIQIALARLGGQRPNLTDPWTGERYDAPSYQGLQISAAFKLTR